MTITYTDGGRISDLILAGRQCKIATLASDISYSLAAGELDIQAIAPIFVGPKESALNNTAKHVALPHWVTDIMILYWLTSVGATGNFTINTSSNDWGICAPGVNWSLPVISIGAFGPTTKTEKTIPIWAIVNADNLDGLSTSASYGKPSAVCIGTNPRYLASTDSRTFMLGANPGAIFSTDTQNFQTNVGYLDPTTSAGNQTVSIIQAPLPEIVCPWFTFTLSVLGTFAADNPNFEAHFRVIGIHME